MFLKLSIVYLLPQVTWLSKKCFFLIVKARVKEAEKTGKAPSSSQTNALLNKRPVVLYHSLTTAATTLYGFAIPIHYNQKEKKQSDLMPPMFQES